MCDIISRDLLSAYSPSGTVGGNLDNIFLWNNDTYWFSDLSSTNTNYFTITSTVPLYVCSVDFVSRAHSCAYPEQFTFTGTKTNGKTDVLITESNGLCYGNNYPDQDGYLCQSNTLKNYKINRRVKYTSFTFTMQKRSHQLPSTAIDMTSVRFYGSMWPIVHISCNGNKNQNYIHILLLFFNAKLIDH